MNPLRAIDRHFMAPEPALRLATVRVLVGAFCVIYLLVRAPVLADFSQFAPNRFEPVGVIEVLAASLPSFAVWGAFGVAVVSGVLFTLGYGFAVSGPLFALSFLWVTSYRNSWGMVFHTDNLAVIHALCLGLAPGAADALSLSRRTRPLPERAARYGWPIRLLCAVTVITYVIAGLAKLRNSGLHWAEGEILRNYIAYDAARKLALGSIHSPLGAWLVQHAWPFPIIGALTLVLELGAPLALLTRRLGTIWVGAVYCFHLGVLLTMAIAFPYPLSGIAFASFLPCERIWRVRPLSRLARALQPAAAPIR